MSRFTARVEHGSPSYFRENRVIRALAQPPSIIPDLGPYLTLSDWAKLLTRDFRYSRRADSRSLNRS